MSNIIIKKPLPTTAEEIYQQKQVEYVLSRLSEMPEEIYIPPISEWTAENRYYPSGVSKHYGKHDWALVPHLKQPLDDCHPDAPYTHITNMKSVQSANTVTLAENAMGFFIRYMLGSILFLTSTKSMGGIRGSANIDVMIDNAGLSGYVKPASNRTGRKTADNTMYKEFMGNIKLLITSYGSIADLKSNTFDLIIEDELDEAGTELKDQGDIEGIIEGRTMGLDIYKILQISTSSRAETSRINRNFLLGDQNEYFLPCPKCGEMQMPVLARRGDKYGLKFTTEKSKKTGQKRLIPETVRYVCKHCGDEFYEHKKRWMLNNGVWIPQSEPEDRKRRSYHSPGLISPFLGWERICQQFIKSKFGDDLLVFKDFTINYLGNPWGGVHKQAGWEVVRDRAEDYLLGTVPKGEIRSVSGNELYCGPLVLYGGVDVQGDRLELLVVGFGPNSEKWIIDHQIFYGKPQNLDDGCWLALDDFVYSHTYEILGQNCYISLCAIDSGWDPRSPTKRSKDFSNKSHIVYDFVAPRSDIFIAVMGIDEQKTTSIIKESRINVPNCPLKKRYDIAVSILKEVVMSVSEQKEGYGTIHVPSKMMLEGIEVPIPDDFYSQFISERFQEDPKKPGHYKWMKLQERNEVLDAYNYACAAAYFQNINSWTNEVWHEYYVNLID